MINIENKPEILIDSFISIKDALKKINSASEGILFVVNNDGKLLGTLTDGDIRRSIIKGVPITETIENVYNRNAYYVFKDRLNKDELKKVLLEHKYGVVPILDMNKIVTGYVTWGNLFDESQSRKIYNHINAPVVIMAGGKGTRLAPFTNVLPKPLIPIGDKTILELIIDEFLKFGIDKYYFITNHKGEMIKAYFDCIERNYNIIYLKETGFWGTAGSLTLLPKDFDKTFIVSNCDIIVKADFADVLDFHKKSGALLTVLSSIQHHKIPYGVIRFGEGGIVTGFEEKPEYSFCINTGIYILESECLKYIPQNKVFHLTQLMEAIMNNGEKVATYPVNESDYTDIGQWEEYRKALVVFDVEKLG